VKPKKILFSLAVIIGIILLVNGNGFAADRYVDDDDVCGGNAPCYTTISEAMTPASSGDDVWVYDGTYSEIVTMKDGVNLENAAGQTPTITCPTAWENAVNFSGSITCNLRGFEIMNPLAGAGIFLNGSGAGITATIENCDVHDSNWGSGIRLNGVVSPTIIGCNIYSNFTAGIATSGVYSDQLESGSSIIIRGNNAITNNGHDSSNKYPGIFLNGSGSGIQVTIGGSEAGDGNTIANNSKAGIRLENIDQVSIENNSSISNNSEAGIRLTDVGSGSADAFIQNNTINANTKAGIRIGGTSYVTIDDNNNIYGNQAGIAVGDVTETDAVQDGSSITIKGNTIGDNTDPNTTAGIYLKGSGGVTVVIGGAGADANTICHNGEAGIRLDTITDLTIDNNTVNNNTQGGMLLIDVGSASDTAIVRNNTINDNTKAGINIGGASYVTIGDNNDVYSNYAGVAFFMGGVVSEPGAPSSGPVTITGNDINRNSKAGISVIDHVTGTITIDDNHFDQNNGSGIAFFNACTAVITDNEIERHTSYAGIFTGDWSGITPSDPIPGSGFDRTNGPVVLTIQRNKVYRNRSGMRLDHASGTISNNLVYNNSRGGIRFSGNSADKAPFPAGGAWGITEIKNNTVAGNGV